MMPHLALVTGAGKGIGKAISLAFAREEIRVILAGRSKSDLDQVAATIRDQGGEATAIALDVTQPDTVTAAVNAIRSSGDRIDILVNNAGAAESSKFLNHDDAVWRRMLDVNLNSVYWVTKAVAPMMVEAGWGRIINIASISSKIGGKYIAAYTAAKHGVLGLTRALAVELMPHHITVNAICPNYVDTPMTDRSIANIAAKTGRSEQEARAAILQFNPQGRLITPEEVALVAAMLVNENAGGITGQSINVDGGAVMF